MMLKSIIGWTMKIVAGYVTGWWFGATTTVTIKELTKNKDLKALDIYATLIGLLVIVYPIVYRVICPAIDWFVDVMIPDKEEPRNIRRRD